jgi:predicted kinase
MKKTTHPTFFIFMGLPASGKSTLAKAWSQRHHFSYFNSDVVRKQLVGNFELASQEDSWGEGIYTSEMTGRTYDAIMINALQELVAGKTVVLDACYGSRDERERLIQLADEINTVLCFVSCYCSEKVTRLRLAERAADTKAVSDAGWEIFKKQRENLEPLDDTESPMVISINTDNTLEHLLEQLDSAFGKKESC